MVSYHFGYSIIISFIMVSFPLSLYICSHFFFIPLSLPSSVKPKPKVNCLPDYRDPKTGCPSVASF